jgi:hypothetical protein
MALSSSPFFVNSNSIWSGTSRIHCQLLLSLTSIICAREEGGHLYCRRGRRKKREVFRSRSQGSRSVVLVSFPNKPFILITHSLNLEPLHIQVGQKLAQLSEDVIDITQLGVLLLLATTCILLGLNLEELLLFPLDR